MQSEKLTGYTLLAVGVLTIIYAAFSVYQVFTKRVDPINLFNFPAISIDTSQIISSQISQDSLPPELAQMLAKSATQQASASAKPTEILSADMINQTSNVFAHLFLMGFVASIGHKLAGLGVMLLRPVEVKVRTKEIPVDTK